tara:strand:+ start:21 stop:302 length:282 start_codon:yes stop_codon:yes gene_type:complete
MERLFDQASLIKILQDGLKKPNPKNPDRMMWTLEDLDKPPPGWTECVNNTKGNKAFPQGYQGVKYRNLARVERPPKQQEKIEIIDPKDFPTTN